MLVRPRGGWPVGDAINRWRPNEKFGSTGAGLIARVPFIDRLVWVDKRVLDVDLENTPVISTDQLRLEVDAYARFRIVDPLKAVVSTGSSSNTEQRVIDALQPLFGSALRNELGKRPFAALLSPERGQMMDNIQSALNRVARQYGAEIVDVRIKHADLPGGTPLDSAYERMRTARTQEARSIEAQGSRQAQIIRADAEAEAVATYARAFNQDPDFYDFYRAMQSYQISFVADTPTGQPPRGRTNIILSPNNEYLRQFRGGGGGGR